MDIFIRYWLPVLAIAISLVSLGISWANSNFRRKLVAVEKRTKLMSLILNCLSDCETLVEIGERTREIELKALDSIADIRDFMDPKQIASFDSFVAKGGRLAEIRRYREAIKSLLKEVSEYTEETDPVEIEKKIPEVIELSNVIRMGVDEQDGINQDLAKQLEECTNFKDGVMNLRKMADEMRRGQEE